MLSDVDIKKRLGINVSIHPFAREKISGCGIYVTASKLAWSLKSGKKISTGDNICIPANDAALIITTEAISLDKTIAGICQSRVSLIKRGLGNNAAPITPGYTGRLLVVLNNRKNKDVSLCVGERIAIIILHELKSEADSEGRSVADYISSGAFMGLDLILDDQDRNELDNEMHSNGGMVKTYMEESQTYIDFTNRKNKGWLTKHIKPLLPSVIPALIGAIIGSVVTVVATAVVTAVVTSIATKGIN